jgi:hypothetical protein
LSPSARRPHIPYTDLNERLKIYGDADVTVSTLTFAVALEMEGRGSSGAL